MDQRVRREGFFFFSSLSSWRLEKVEEGDRGRQRGRER